MRLTELPVDIASVQISDEQSQVRSVGLHVSDIIRYMAVSAGLKEDNKFTRAMLDMFAIVGRIFERVMAESMFRPPRYERVGQMECDGIIGSPDAVDMQDNVVMEFKVTWKSSSHDIGEFIEYLWQVKSYCYMIGANTARLYVFFICGNWRPPVPVFKAWEIAFTDMELLEHWKMMKANERGAIEWSKQQQTVI